MRVRAWLPAVLALSVGSGAALAQPLDIAVGCTAGQGDADGLLMALRRMNLAPDAGFDDAGVFWGHGTGPGGTVRLAPGCTYTLSWLVKGGRNKPETLRFWMGASALPLIVSNVVVEGNGATLDVDNPPNEPDVGTRLFTVAGSIQVPDAGPPSGAPPSCHGYPCPGRLTLRNLTLKGGRARGGTSGAAGGGGAGLGGAILVQGELILSGVTLTQNWAIGGRGWNDKYGAGGGLSGLGAQGGGGFLGWGYTETGGAGGALGDSSGPTGLGAGTTEDADWTCRVVGMCACAADHLPCGSSLSAPWGAGGIGNGDGDVGGGGSGPTICLTDCYGRCAPSCMLPVRAGNGGFGAGGGSIFTGSGLFPFVVGGHGGLGGGGGVGWIGGNGGFGGGGAAHLGRGGFGAGGGGWRSGFEVFDGGVGVPGFGAGRGLGRGGAGAGLGGAIFIHGGKVLAVASTFSDNRAVGGVVGRNVMWGPRHGEHGGAYGGAIFNLDGELTLISTTFVDNRVEQGVSPDPDPLDLPGQVEGNTLYVRHERFASDTDGWLDRVPTVRLSNTLITSSAPGDDCGLSFADGGVLPDFVSVGSVVSAPGSCPFSTLPSDAGPANLVVDRDAGLVEALANNGGPTQTHALLADSPALAAGVCAEPTDQRGVPRILEPLACDVGAYERARAHVTVVLTGDGEGTVTGADGGIDCGASCEALVDPFDAPVALEATPGPLTDFLGWDGGDCGVTTSCEVTAPGRHVIEARFDYRRHPIDILFLGDGAGIITADGGARCTADCTLAVRHGDGLTLSAAAAPQSVFQGWSGVCSGTADCTVTDVRAPVHLGANFQLLRAELAVELLGSGRGTVRLEPSALVCSAACTTQWPVGSAVSLEATPAAGSDFVGWFGACGDAGRCELVVASPLRVVAVFELMDAGTTDGGALDAGTTDAGPLDAGPLDAGAEDAGSADAGDHDAADGGEQPSVDAGPGPSTPQRPCGCSSGGELLGLALVVALRRRAPARG